MNNDFSTNWSQNEENPKKCFLFRGLPSSGKSYSAIKLAESYGIQNPKDIICSADHFWGETKEEYIKNWCIEKLGQAHKSCQTKARTLMQRQENVVIIDNTNTRISEAMPYFEMAVQYGYHFQVREAESPWWLEKIKPYLHDKVLYQKELKEGLKILFEKNQESHGVPLDAFEKMLNRYVPEISIPGLANLYTRE
jgi:predicted kinase